MRGTFTPYSLPAFTGAFDLTPMSLQLIYPATRIQYFVTGSKQLKSKCQYFTIVPEFSPGIQNEDLSREIHEVTARPISHGLTPLFFVFLSVMK